MKFENLWSRVIFKARIKGWHYCTMLGAYTLDERHKAHGLKFLGFTRYGTPDYDKGMVKYLSADTSNGFNKIDEAPLDELLLYNAIDAKITSQVFRDEINELKEHRLKRVYGFLHKGSLALSELEIEGFPVSRDHFNQTDKSVVKKISTLNTALMTDKDVKKFEKLEGRAINFKSSKDMRKLLFEIKGIDSEKKTKSGEDAVDKSTLYELDDPWCKKLLELRKYEKIKSTYPIIRRLFLIAKMQLIISLKFVKKCVIKCLKKPNIFVVRKQLHITFKNTFNIEKGKLFIQMVLLKICKIF
jgi:DNA polymerase I-like protein with 3'-5' exonuclease and polymerase domains